MVRTSLIAAVTAFVLFLVSAAPTTAGPISVYFQIYRSGGSLDAPPTPGTDEISIPGLGTRALLTTTTTDFGGLDRIAVVPADQTSVRQPVLGLFPLMEFRDRAHYEAERGTVVTVPETVVWLYAEVWNGEYAASEYRQMFFPATITARVGTEPGENEVDWRLIESTKQVVFGDTTVSFTLEPVRMPDGQPYIRFLDDYSTFGSSPIYYPTVLEATVEVTRTATPPDDPGTGASDGVTTPEPAGALLLAGLFGSGLAVHRRAGYRHQTGE
jgi:hypothetical protein